MQVFVTINNTGMEISVCECKELIDTGLCDKGFVWNPSNCDCKCDKSCDISEYLEYSNFKFRKNLVDKLVEECTENIEEARLVECCSCAVYMVVF